MQVYSSLSGIPFYAPSAGYAPTNSADVSAIASAYAASAASGKQDELTFGYDGDDKISSIDGSALAGGGMVSSIQTARDPWYQQSISGINGSSIYPKWAESAISADTAKSADYASNAFSASHAPTSWASSFISSVSSPSGTIRVLNSNEIEGTNSAVLPSTVVEGFTSVSSLGTKNAFSFTVPTSNQNTQVIITGGWADGNIGISGDNGTTGGSSLSGPVNVTFDMPGATAFDVSSDVWIGNVGYTASALASEVGGGVGELAWASALPTYQYNSADKISGINGSALAGGGEADWSAESGQPGYIENKPVPKTLVAGAGITITENSTGLVVGSTNTLYNAGSGLSLNGTTFSVDTATVQGTLTYDYDASGNISGIDGSALVGGDPEATDLYVQAPLYTGVSGGSSYIGWNNETVLYSDYTGRPINPGDTISLNESPLNFQYVEVYLNGTSATSTVAGWANSYQKVDTVTLSSVPGLTFVGLLSGNSTWWDVGCAYSGVSSTTWTKVLGYTKQVDSTAAGMTANAGHLNIWKVVGLNRTAGE